MNKILSALILVSAWLTACNDSSRSHKKTDFRVFDRYHPHMSSEQEELLSDLFYNACDTVIRHYDTAWVTSRKYDTTIVETGIFYYLPYDYQLSVASPSRYMTEMALDFRKQGANDSATAFFRKVVAYEDAINKAQHDDDGGLCGDANSMLSVGVNNAILASYAYTQLGDTTNALTVLKPWLANVEAHPGIYRWFGRLCEQHYGKAAWGRELDGCFKTVHRLEDDHLGETSDWAVSVFGASIGIGNADEEGVTENSSIDRAVSWFFCTDPELM